MGEKYPYAVTSKTFAAIKKRNRWKIYTRYTFSSKEAKCSFYNKLKLFYTVVFKGCHSVKCMTSKSITNNFKKEYL